MTCTCPTVHYSDSDLPAMAHDLQFIYNHVEGLLLLLERFSSLVLCHELFLCVVVMERREYSLCRVIVKILLGLVIIIIGESTVVWNKQE